MIKPLPVTGFAVALACLCFSGSSYGQSEAALQELGSQEATIPQVLKVFEPQLSPKLEAEGPGTGLQSDLNDNSEILRIPRNIKSGDDERLPPIDTPQFEPTAQRPVSQKVVHWKSDDFCHRHLLFEERNLERHGVPKCEQTKQLFRSGTRFFSKALFLPISVATKKPLKYQCGPGK